ncbi:MAG: hypothetical protein OXH79_11235 [Boseongicola sp.]|nr:hypothetical protein [Boseongicola sp.]
MLGLDPVLQDRQLRLQRPAIETRRVRTLVEEALVLDVTRRILVARRLFFETLAFDTAGQLDQVRLGVLLGSGLSALFGFAVLKYALRHRPVASGAAEEHVGS